MHRLTTDIEALALLDDFSRISMQGYIKVILIFVSLVDIAVQAKNGFNAPQIDEQIKTLAAESSAVKKKLGFHVEGLDRLFYTLQGILSDLQKQQLTLHSLTQAVFVGVANVRKYSLTVPRVFFKLVDPVRLQVKYLDNDEYLTPGRKTPYVCCLNIGSYIRTILLGLVIHCVLW
jgi:hypothetical protein